MNPCPQPLTAVPCSSPRNVGGASAPEYQYPGTPCRSTHKLEHLKIRSAMCMYTHARTTLVRGAVPRAPSTLGRVHTKRPGRTNPPCLGGRYDVATIPGRAICRYTLHTYVPHHRPQHPAGWCTQNPHKIDLRKREIVGRQQHPGWGGGGDAWEGSGVE